MNNEQTGIAEKILKELAAGLLIAYRVKNHSLDYSIMNRPEPTLSGVDDHALATALTLAGNSFKLIHDTKAGNQGKAESVSRDDGRTVSYNEFIDIDWEKKVIRTTRRGQMTFTILEAVIGDLIRKAVAARPAAKVN